MVVVEGEEGVSKEIKDACKTAGLKLDIIGAMEDDSELDDDADMEEDSESESE